MRTETRLQVAACHSIQGTQNAAVPSVVMRIALAGNRRKEVEDHGDVVEDICADSRGFTFWSQHSADAVCELDRS